ncbi:hypothetical protein BDV98DRAFT_568189, partial [Pterulicium gracile]
HFFPFPSTISYPSLATYCSTIFGWPIASHFYDHSHSHTHFLAPTHSITMMFTFPQRANILLILLAFFSLFTTVLAAPSSLRGKRYVVNNSNDVVGNDIVVKIVGKDIVDEILETRVVSLPRGLRFEEIAMRREGLKNRM